MLESNNQNFNHLKIHTQYSICEGAIKIENLKDFCKENKITSLGLSDTSNLCGALEFAENISKVGTQPIIGTQIYFKFEDTTGLLPLIALNEKGYKRIIELSSKSLGWGGISWEGKGLEEVGKRVDTGEIVIRIDPRYFRPAEVDSLLGDSKKAHNKLGWHPKIKLNELIQEMIESDKKEALKESILKEKGFQVTNASINN